MPFEPMQLAFDIFIADGGVDDFEAMTDDTLLTIIYRELPTLLALDVLNSARQLAKEGR